MQSASFKFFGDQSPGGRTAKASHGGVPIPDNGRTERLLRSAGRAQLIIGAAYLYDSLILFGYWAAGYVGLGVPIVVLVLLAALLGAVRLAHASGWSRAQSDPTLFLPQQLYAIAVVLGVAAAAPQIGFQPFATLFAISAFSFMAPNPKSLVISWIAVAIGAAAVIFAVGPQLSIPASTLAGQALTAAVVIGLLVRCIWIAMFVRKLRDRLAEKNESLRKAMVRIETLANLDEVTGLPNRRAIAGALQEQMAQSHRSGLPLSLAYIDLDHFKRINDIHGHLAGDRALRLIAAAARGAIRDTDRIGRFGGEEFLLIMTGAALADAREPLERLRARIASLDWSEIDSAIQMTVTIGAAQYAAGESFEALVRRADLALYLGKEEGRNRVILNPPVERPRPRALSA